MEWVKLKSKWENQCPRCENTILEGSDIYWKKGEKAIHEHCLKNDNRFEFICTKCGSNTVSKVNRHICFDCEGD